MTISEFVIGSLRPDVAREGHQALRTGVPEVFSEVSGSLSNDLGHVIKHNGKDVSSEYPPLLALEWNDASDFHAFYPASEGFKQFVGIFAPYAAAKAIPKLFQPTEGVDSFADIFALGAAHVIIVSNAQSKKEELTSAWDDLIKEVSKEGKAVQWSGWGIDAEEGTWAAALGGKEVGDVERQSQKLVQKLKNVSGLDEYIVSFS